MTENTPCRRVSQKQTFVPSIDQVLAMEPKLNEWASMAAHAYGTYAGINDAIRQATEKRAPIVQHADHYRQMAALLCVVRTFATIDRGSELSLQSVYRYLQSESAIEEVAQVYAVAPAPTTPDIDLARSWIGQYQIEYAKINWTTLGAMQSFRNSAIAHISWRQVERFVSYGELEELVRIVSALAGQLTLMTTGVNNWPEEHQRLAHSDAKHKWSAIFAADASDKIKY